LRRFVAPARLEAILAVAVGNGTLSMFLHDWESSNEFSHSIGSDRSSRSSMEPGIAMQVWLSFNNNND
jgi:hypothetical protein